MMPSTSLMLHLYLAESNQEIERCYENPFSSDFKSWRILQFNANYNERDTGNQRNFERKYLDVVLFRWKEIPVTTLHNIYSSC